MSVNFTFQTCLLVWLVNCYYSQSGSSGCAENALRLRDGRSTREGRLEICLFGVWGTVCNDGWTLSNTVVVCRQLGIGTRGYAVAGYPGGPAGIFLSEVQCTGEEAQLSECTIGVRINTGPINCQHSEDVQLICLPPEIPTECNSGRIRLAGGTSPSSGRLEVCMGGVWGTVCSDLVSLPTTAMVACRQLGIPATSELASGGAPGSGPIFLTSLQCRGFEQSILDCPGEDTIPYDHCRHHFDLSIYCLNVSKPECLEGEVRLIDGVSYSEGRLEICQDGVWGSVCDAGWKQENNLVVCRQLGINATSVHFGRYGNADRPYFLRDVQCDGDEENLLNCSLTRYPSFTTALCDSDDAVGIVCTNSSETECTDGDIQLVDFLGAPAQNGSGIVEFCYQGFWTKLCNRLWGIREAVIVCNKLDLLTSNGVIGYLVYDESFSGPVASVLCFGSSFNSSCFVSSSACGHYGHGAVSCGQTGDPVCTNGDIRVTGEGRLEVCHIGIWGTVCDDHWTVQNTMVACRQLGLPVQSATYMSTFHVPSLGPIFIDTIECAGNESNLSSCTATNDLNLHDCTNIEDVHIFCLNINDNGVTSVLPASATSVTSSGSATVVPTSVTQLNLLVVLPVVLISVTCSVIFTFAVGVWAFRRSSRIKSIVMPRSASTNMANQILSGVALERNRFNTYEDSSSLRTTSRSIPANVNRNKLVSLLSSDIQISMRSIQIESKIGEGEFGIVYKATLQRTAHWSETVAVKTLKGISTPTEMDEILEEASKLRNFNHANVLGLIGICIEGCPMPYLIMPYMSNGSLFSYLRREKENLVLPRESDIEQVADISKRLVAMCQQIASGMEYLTANKFVHRDLATRNCMIDDEAIIKIGDFGLCEELYTKNYYHQDSHRAIRLPVKWMAIECLQEGIFSEKSDVWAFGITCWEIFSGGKTPYPGVNPMDLTNFLDCGSRLSKPHNAACSKEIYDLMLTCWKCDPTKRPGFSTIKHKLDRKLEEMSGYLSICMNLFPEICPAKVSRRPKSHAPETLHVEQMWDKERIVLSTSF